jgi:hypothetical protein
MLLYQSQQRLFKATVQEPTAVLKHRLQVEMYLLETNQLTVKEMHAPAATH